MLWTVIACLLLVVLRNIAHTYCDPENFCGRFVPGATTQQSLVKAFEIAVSENDQQQLIHLSENDANHQSIAELLTIVARKNVVLSLEQNTEATYFAWIHVHDSISNGKLLTVPIRRTVGRWFLDPS